MKDEKIKKIKKEVLNYLGYKNPSSILFWC